MTIQLTEVVMAMLNGHRLRGAGSIGTDPVENCFINRVSSNQPSCCPGWNATQPGKQKPKLIYLPRVVDDSRSDDNPGFRLKRPVGSFDVCDSDLKIGFACACRLGRD